MLRNTLKTIVFIAFLAFSSNTIFAQDNKIDFKVEWKNDSVNNVIKVTILSGEPARIMIYDNAPLDNGKLISKTDILSKKYLEIITDKKINLCVCVIKDATNFNCKWLDIEK